MNGGRFLWRGEPVAFCEGESIAVALMNAGVRGLGAGGEGSGQRYFCGIGAGQNCLVAIDGVLVEACLTPARDGLDVEAAEVGHD
jgi:aerobic-type carbon monoxide dehydrogenase small subunit (CoxS/CutS family)